jgi:hypothetical protein
MNNFELIILYIWYSFILIIKCFLQIVHVYMLSPSVCWCCWCISPLNHVYGRSGLVVLSMCLDHYRSLSISVYCSLVLVSCFLCLSVSRLSFSVSWLSFSVSCLSFSVLSACFSSGLDYLGRKIRHVNGQIWAVYAPYFYRNPGRCFTTVCNENTACIWSYTANMVMEVIDRHDNHEVYQAKTYLHQSLAFLVQ